MNYISPLFNELGTITRFSFHPGCNKSVDGAYFVVLLQWE